MIPQKLIDRTEFLRRRMKELCGVDALEDTRLAPVVYCRVLIVQVLVNDGWSDAEIGEAVGRNRTTIIHYHKRFADIATMICYESWYYLWKSFNKAIIDMNQEQIDTLHRLEYQRNELHHLLSCMDGWGRHLHEVGEKGKFYVQIVDENGHGLCLSREISREEVEKEYNAELKRLNDEKARIEKEIEEL